MARTASAPRRAGQGQQHGEGDGGRVSGVSASSTAGFYAARGEPDVQGTISGCPSIPP